VQVTKVEVEEYIFLDDPIAVEVEEELADLVVVVALVVVVFDLGETNSVGIPVD
jgi:hypothetical protein